MHPRPLPEDDLRFVARRVRWEALREARVFVAGGTGFFGRWLVESLLWADAAFDLGVEIVVLARTPGRLPEHPRLTFLRGDVRDFEFPDGPVTHLLHLATDSTLPPTDANAERTVDTLVNGTRRLLRFARERGARKFLLASSGAVYGPQPTRLERIPETYAGGPLLEHPLAPYAEAKRVAEVLVRRSGLDATVARGFAFVGPGLPLDAHFAAGNFVRDGLAGRPIEIRSDGTAVRTYLDAADLAIWLWTILLEGEGTYNVGSERAFTILELATLVARATDTEVRVAPEATAQPTSHRYVPDTSRARRELGLEESFSLEDAIRRTVRYHETKEPVHA